RRAAANSSSSSQALRSEHTSALSAVSSPHRDSINDWRSPSGSASASLKIASISGSICGHSLIEQLTLTDGSEVHSVRNAEIRRQMNQRLRRSIARSRMQAAKQPGLDELHLPVNAGLGGIHEGRRFLRSAAEEEPQFHELNL